MRLRWSPSRGASWRWKQRFTFCLGVQGHKELGGLLRQAQREGLIDAGEFSVLDAVRVPRNTIVHSALRPSFPPAAAVEMVDGLHQAIAGIYGRAAQRSQPIT